MLLNRLCIEISKENRENGEQKRSIEIFDLSFDCLVCLTSFILSTYSLSGTKGIIDGIDL